MTSSKPDDLPSVPCPNTSTLAVKVSVCEFGAGGFTKIQFIFVGTWQNNYT